MFGDDRWLTDQVSYLGGTLPAMTTRHITPAYRWRSLTTELGNTKSPVTVFIKQRFPNVKDTQRQYRNSVAALVADSGGSNAGTLGDAFDWAVRFLVHPQPSLELALVGVIRRFPQLGAAAIEMAGYLGYEHSSETPNAHLGSSRFDGPTVGCTVDEETLLRGCWALGLLTQVFRLGEIRPGSDLAKLDFDRVCAADLLALTPPPALEELRHLCSLTRSALLPAVANRRGPWAIGPTFEGSKLMRADADLIARGLLVELKTNLGDKRADGTRRASLDGSTLHQVLGYVLLDFPDEFAIDEVGLYAARYGHLATWRLPELLDELAGRSVDLAAERAAFRDMLSTRP
jgi:hypothetical protein